MYKRQNHDRNGGLTILNALCKLYLTIVRGTPVMIQLLILSLIHICEYDRLLKQYELKQEQSDT